MGKTTTLADVAAHAGVSTQTVSNALNKPQLLRRATLDRVLRSVEALDYSANPRVPRLRQRTVANIGVRIEPITGVVASSLIDRFLHELSARADVKDDHVLLFTATSDEEEVRKIRELARQRVADRFILTSTHQDDARVPALVKAGIRFVAFGRPWGAAPEHSWVDVDGASGVAEATEALIDAGHRRIGFLGWHRSSDTGNDRHRGWARAMQLRLGCDTRQLEALTARSEDSLESAMPEAERLIRSGVEAIVCVSDSLGMGAADVAMRLGRALPVIGFDNTLLAFGIGFPSIDQSLGEVAAATLAALDDDGITTTMIQPRLERREHPHWGINPPAPTTEGGEKG